MGVARKVSIASLVAIGAIAYSGLARAQAIGSPPTFPVQISTTQPGATVTLRGPEGDVDCGERCGLTLPLRSYKLIVKDADGHLSTQRLDVNMPTHATVTPPDHGTRVFGMTAGVVGVVAAAAGAATLIFALFLRAVERIDCDGMACTSDDVPSWMWYGGGIGMAAGLALGVTGLILWRQNAHADVRVDAFAPTPGKDARLRLAPAAGPRWAGLALTARF